MAQRFALLVIALASAATPHAQAQGTPVSQGYWMNHTLEYDGSNITHIGDGRPDYTRRWEPRAGLTTSGGERAEPHTVDGSVTNSGRVRPWFRWVRRTIAQNNGRYTTYTPDPSDNPPASLIIGVTGSGSASATSDYVNGGPIPAQNRIASKEHVTITIFGESAAPRDDAASSSTVANLLVNKVLVVSAGAAMQTSPEGYEILPGPWLNLLAEGKVDGGRYGNVNGYGSGGLGGYVRNALSFGSTTISVEPSPQNIALDDGSTKGLNQYTIDVGIPTRVNINSSEPALVEKIRQGSSWSLAGTAPALRPFLDNLKEFGQGTAVVTPQHPGLATSATQNPTPTPESGLKFDVRIPNTYPSNASDDGWRFPADNSKFGEKTLNHNVGGTTIPAPVALFYPWNGYQHPKGGPKGYHIYKDSSGVEHELAIHTPNWFYYYDKAWQNPWGIPLTFWDKNSSQSVPGSTSERMYVGYDTHGSNTGQIETELFAFVPGSTGLQWVGSESTRGIDTYKRVVSHECTHLLISRMLVARDPQTNALLYPDTDPDANGYPVGDEMPDALETYVSPSSPGNGLSSLGADTTGWALAYDPVTYSPYADQEVFCRMIERDLFGPMDQDWANDGLNHGRPVAPNRQNRTALHLKTGFDPNTLTFPAPGSVPVLPAPTPAPGATP